MTSTSYKSPMKSMFSSVFKREDLKVQKSKEPDSSSYHFRSHSQNLDNSLTTPHKISNYSNKSQLTDISANISLNESYVKVNRSPSKPSESKENIKSHSKKCLECDLKYEELYRKYEKIQEFYKSQISRLTEEVTHYKTLYHKLLIQHSAEKKIVRNEFFK